MKFIRYPLFIRYTVLIIGIAIMTIIASTIGPSAANTNAASLAGVTGKPGSSHAHRHIIPHLPPAVRHDLSRPLRQAINAPRYIKVQPVERVNVIKAKEAASVGQASTTCPSPTIDLKVLVLASDGTEADLPAIQQTLDYLGTPYTLYIASQHPDGLTPDVLSDGSCHGYYEGVILTNGQLVYYNGSSYVSALSQQEWTNLWTYEATLGIRELSWYTYPTSDFGYQVPSASFDTTSSPVATTLTSQGQSAFQYLQPGATVTIQNAYTYLAQPLADGSTTPFLVDASGNALAAVRTTADGRQVLSLTFDSNANLLHNLILSYGLVNWVTNGLFLGEKHIYISGQADDLFIDDNVWPPSTTCGTNVEQTGAVYRINSADLQTFVSWQQAKQAQPITQNFRMTLAFNGYGTTADAGYSPDTLTPAAQAYQDQFNWINHTYDHTTLDTMNYADSSNEINLNNQIASQLGLTNYSIHNMVTPNVSGLTNPNFLQAAYDSGIRYLVTDTSIAGYNNPTPNAGIYSSYQPSILMIPRHPNNLFYNVSQPAEWVAEYNCLYFSYWGRNLSYQEILDQESNTLLTYMLKGDIDPWMFHQPNMRAYDGTHSLLGDLLDLTFQKYSQYYNLPLVNKSMDEIGATVADRMQYNNAGVTASVVPGVSITLTAQQAATVPVTGLKSAGAESYGGQSISYIPLSAGQSVTLPLA